MKIKRNVTISSLNWVDDTLVSGFWIYEITDVDITEDTIVDVNIHLADLEKAEHIKPATESFAEKVRLYASEKPALDIITDIKLIKQVGVA